MLFLCVMYSCYQDLLAQFVSKHKDLASTTINLVVADVQFMDKFVLMGGKTKPSAPGRTPCSPAMASVITNKHDKEHLSPWEWLSTFEKLWILGHCHRSLRSNFYCSFCHSMEKHHP